MRSGSAKWLPPAASGLRARTRSRTSWRSAMSSALSTGCPPGCPPCRALGTVPGSGDEGAETAARGEIADDGGADGFGGGYDILEDAVDDVLLKNPQITIGEQVYFVGLELETALIGDVAEHEAAEIGQAGFGADAGEFGEVDLDFVIGKLVGPGFDFGEDGGEAAGGVLVGIGAFHARAFERRSRKRPTSATMPTAWPVPRSLTLVATAGLISTQTTRTQLGSMLPVAMEWSMEPRQRTRPASLSWAA